MIGSACELTRQEFEDFVIRTTTMILYRWDAVANKSRVLEGVWRGDLGSCPVITVHTYWKGSILEEIRVKGQGEHLPRLMAPHFHLETPAAGVVCRHHPAVAPDGQRDPRFLFFYQKAHVRQHSPHHFRSSTDSLKPTEMPSDYTCQENRVVEAWPLPLMRFWKKPDTSQSTAHFEYYW